MKRIREMISLCMTHHRSVLLIGPHGVGKTQMVRQEASRQGLVMKYFSAPTLDPWADLVGIPVPTAVTAEGPQRRQLDFIRPPDVDSAQMLFFDELNRAHTKVQNAVLEAIQFRSINGQPLPRLQMVWAAVNPPGDGYHASELEPALLDRFQVHLTVPPRPSVEYYKDAGKLPEKVARTLVTWWERDLDDRLRKVISPRRLEYIGQSYLLGIDLKFTMPQAESVPLANLVHRLDGSSELPFELTPQTLVSRQAELLDEMKANPSVMLMVSERLAAWPEALPNAVPLFLALSSELQAQLARDPKVRMPLANLARDGRKGNIELRPLADRLIAMGVIR